MATVADRRVTPDRRRQERDSEEQILEDMDSVVGSDFWEFKTNEEKASYFESYAQRYRFLKDR
jgi:hypothetical protein